MRFLFAILIAPLVPALFLVASSPFAALVVAKLSYVVFVLVGLPVMLALRHFGKLNFVSLLLTGAVIGALSLLIFGTWIAALLGSLGSPTSSGFGPLIFMWGATFGALAAGIFGAIVGAQNRRLPKAEA